MGLGFLGGFGAAVLALLVFAGLLAWGGRIWHEVEESDWDGSSAFAAAIGLGVVILVCVTVFLGVPPSTFT